MNKTFVSVPVKLLGLILTTLLLMSAGFSTLSLWRLEDEFTQFQNDRQKLSNTQFLLEKDKLDNQLRVWVESFVDIIAIGDQPDFKQLREAVAQQFYALQLHLNVDELWLVDANLQPLWLSADTTSRQIREQTSRVLELQEPVSMITCDQQCQLITSVPVINGQGDTAVMTLAASLIDVVFLLNQSLDSDVAIVSFESGSSLELSKADVLSSTNVSLMREMMALKNPETTMQHALNQGVSFETYSEHYLLNFLPLSSANSQDYYLMLIDNVTEFKEKNESYRRYFLITELLIFIGLASLVFFITSPITRRLVNLANALPMLAQKQFSEFRKVPLNRQSFFVDELDLLANSAQELSFELEQLNIEVEQKTLELENIAMYDLLTGLPNRNMLNLQLRKSLANLQIEESGLSVLFLDLDDFKKVNDSHGHGEGDRLLEEAANRVRTGVRKVDMACRFGGDEFVVILNSVRSIDDAIFVAEDILNRFKKPIKLGSSIFYVTTSIGIVYTEDGTQRAEDLISYADIAMYEAKKHGGAQYHIYHPDLYQQVAQRVELEGAVRQALLKKQFSLSLQPQLDSKTKRLVGFEALLRWYSPERGMIPPDDFIPILENSEYMVELGYWVMRRCFEIAIELRSQGVKDVRIAINLSAMQFLDPNLTDYLLQLTRRFEISAKYFELELTEQTLVSDIDKAIEVMKGLKKIGFSFAIDDFGTGYSSLAYIKKMPIDVIKIDKSFVFGMLENHSDYQIIISTIAMVKNLGLNVVAEGVESGAQLRSLTLNDCDTIQGYYFSKPLPESELSTFLAEKIVDGHWKTQVKKSPQQSD
ncbi:MAG: EAL domain-containing protein [Thalassotalea sp.]|nr:EAL domain-containing protein [Thalassotalea sp.]